MEMLVSEIVTRVRAAIDELMENDSQFLRETSDELNLTRTIVDKIGYALQWVIENAPADRLDSDMFEELTTAELQEAFSIDTTDQDCLVARLILPDGLLRIVDARLSSWSLFPVPALNTSQIYLMQQDKYARGSWDRPVNILNPGTLEMYCAKTAEDTLIFKFVRKPDVSAVAGYDPTDPTDDTEVSVPTRLVAALIYQIAGLAMVAFREQVASSLFAIAQKHLYPDAATNE